jgi:hypothetical protein
MLKKCNDVMISAQSCPVCGKHKWYPFSLTDTDELIYAEGEFVTPVIDDAEGCAEVYDECVNCGTVIC